MRRLKAYIHASDEWPNFRWRLEDFVYLLVEARNLQGRILGKMDAMGFETRTEASLETLTLDVVKTSEIEGEFLRTEEVRSSIARKIGLEQYDLMRSGREVEGVVEMMLDATRNCFDPLTRERLFDWHAALFPSGRSGLYRITVADWRSDTTGPMQVVSGAPGKEKVYYEAPASARLEMEMCRFIDWFNAPVPFDLMLKAAVAHLWFVSIHPFDDGNGRMARALTDMLLARSDNSPQRFYSMSALIQMDRKSYYQILEQTQQGNLDITEWIIWFLNCLIQAFRATDQTLARVLFKAGFWNTHLHTELNERQRKVLNKLLDGFEGHLSSSRYARMCGCSRDSAIRDLNDLLAKDILRKSVSGGRSTSYVLDRESLSSQPLS